MTTRRGVLDAKYIFEYDVGQWTFGTSQDAVKVLKDKETGNLKTCKTVPKTDVTSSSAVSRLKGLKELQHPHICHVTDVLEDKSSIYIISDFCNGGDLQDWMERLDEANWLQEQTCAAYVRQLALALAHSHAAQAYHRDMRPSSLLLTSKLPDAQIKVSDMGLAQVLDADNRIVQTGPANPYTAPEVLSGRDPVRNGAADMWSLGAIAHRLLVGHAPGQRQGESSGWSFTARSRSSNDEAWAERSAISRDFVQRLLRSADERPTAAKMLQHPWLKGLTPLSGVNWRADNDTARDIRHKTLCYTLAVLLVPALVPFRDFEQLRIAFHQSDPDHDGFVPKKVGQRLLLTRCNLTKAVDAAVSIVDVGRTDVLDLCAAACADLIAREFFAAGPTGSPLAGPFRATDLAPRMLKRFFEVFGDRRQPAVNAANVRSRLRTATARDVELHANVRYDELLDCLPEDRAIDSQLLTTQLSSNAVRGTPLGDGEMSPLKTESPWSNTFGGLDMINIFQSCAVGSSVKREESPHSVRIF